jgi:hypothetical protein
MGASSFRSTLCTSISQCALHDLRDQRVGLRPAMSVMVSRAASLPAWRLEGAYRYAAVVTIHADRNPRPNRLSVTA